MKKDQCLEAGENFCKLTDLQIQGGILITFHSVVAAEKDQTL